MQSAHQKRLACVLQHCEVASKSIFDFLQLKYQLIFLMHLCRTWSTEARETSTFVSGMTGASSDEAQVLCIIPLQCGTKAIAGNHNGNLR